MCQIASENESSTVVATKKINIDSSIQDVGLTLPEKTQTAAYRNFFILGFILILIFLAVLYNVHPKFFREYYDVSRILSFKAREGNLYKKKPLAGDNLIFVLFNSLVITFLLIVSLYFVEGAPDIIRKINFEQMLNSTLWWIGLSFILFIMLIVRYILIRNVSYLFRLSKIRHIQFYDLLRMSKIFYGFCVVVIALLFLGFKVTVDISLAKIVLLVLIFSFFKVFLLFFRLQQMTSFRKMYLFSYICGTEILPVLFGIKIFLNN